MTFDELFAQHQLTADERRDLVTYLCLLRARRLMALLCPP